MINFILRNIGDIAILSRNNAKTLGNLQKKINTEETCSTHIFVQKLSFDFVVSASYRTTSILLTSKFSFYFYNKVHEHVELR